MRLASTEAERRRRDDRVQQAHLLLYRGVADPGRQRCLGQAAARVEKVLPQHVGSARGDTRRVHAHVPPRGKVMSDM